MVKLRLYIMALYRNRTGHGLEGMKLEEWLQDFCSNQGKGQTDKMGVRMRRTAIKDYLGVIFSRLGFVFVFTLNQM